MSALRSLIRIINEPSLRSPRVQRDKRDLWRLISKYYLIPHWPKVLIGVLGGSLAGVMVYAYAAAGRVVADDIVQVHLLVADRPPAEKLDPTRLGEQRRFGFDEPNARSVVSQLESKPGRRLSLQAKPPSQRLLKPNRIPRC